MNGYLPLGALKAALGNSDTPASYDDELARAINAASRQIDSCCGTRFWRESSPTPRLFMAGDPHTVWTGDFATTDGVVVATDEDGDGVFETVWAADEWRAQPLVQVVSDRPFTHVVATGARRFPCRGRRWAGSPLAPLVQVTAAWGWPSVPAEVVQACQILAIDHFKSKDLTGGVAGFGEYNPVRVSAFNPQAKALIEHLRVPVFG